MQIKQKRNQWWLLSLALLIRGAGYAQDIPEEWTIENSGADELEQLVEFGDGSKSGFSAKIVSLRRFCPPVGNQTGQPSSHKLGWAAGYGMMSILHAQNTKARTVDPFSAQFPIDLLPKSGPACRLDNYVPHLRTILTQTGNVKASIYDKKKADCTTQPAKNWEKQAISNRIDALYPLFNKTSRSRISSAAQIEFATKSSLSKGRPVMAVLMIDDAFRQLRSDTWRPSNVGRVELQPVVVIGYDDNRQAFEILNSMGTSWGNKGYAWIRYTDFCEWSQLGLQMIWNPKNPTPPPGPQPSPSPTPVPPQPVVLRGGGELRYVAGSTDDSYLFDPVVVQHRGKYYETEGRFDINDGLQFTSNQLPQYGYVYILSLDTTKTVDLHFPKAGESAYIADKTSRLVFPRPQPAFDEEGRLVMIEKQFVKNQLGTDWLIVLFSKHRIPDTQLNLWKKALAVPSHQLVKAIEEHIGKDLVPWQSTEFAPHKMQFKVNATAQGTIVPLLIKINGF